MVLAAFKIPGTSPSGQQWPELGPCSLGTAVWMWSNSCIQTLTPSSSHPIHQNALILSSSAPSHLPIPCPEKSLYWLNLASIEVTYPGISLTLLMQLPALHWYEHALPHAHDTAGHSSADKLPRIAPLVSYFDKHHIYHNLSINCLFLNSLYSFCQIFITFM